MMIATLTRIRPRHKETQTELARLTWMDTPTSTARHLRPATVNGKIDF